ncbi:MAG: 50S ribosomal protein L25 [Chloroflexi bacterium]|nr:50S ribosomal protein L25 [Chloroflexota bacterium]
MAETIILEASKREVTGKQVKQLRANGVIPGTLYGPTFEPISLQVNGLELRSVLIQAGGSHLIQLSMGGEMHNALVRSVQRDPIRGHVLHVDFYRVRMDVAIRTEIPVITIGDKVALEKAGLILIHEMGTVEIECLPGDLPAEIRIDVSALRTAGDTILAAQLPAFEGVTYHVDPDAVVVYATSATQREAEEEEAPASVEPELIRRRPTDEEEE